MFQVLISLKLKILKVERPLGFWKQFQFSVSQIKNLKSGNPHRIHHQVVEQISQIRQASTATYHFEIVFRELALKMKQRLTLMTFNHL